MEALKVMSLIALCIVGANGQVVNTTPAERPVQDSVRFVYEGTQHYLVGVMLTNCFLAPLTLVETDHVTVFGGIEDIMLTMMKDWIGVLPETRIYHDDPNLPEYIKTVCTVRDIFLLDRNLPVQTTHASPLGG